MCDLFLPNGHNIYNLHRGFVGLGIKGTWMQAPKAILENVVQFLGLIWECVKCEVFLY